MSSTSSSTLVGAAFEHVNPRSRIVVGVDTHLGLPEMVAAMGAQRVFVVCGRTVSVGPQMQLLRDVLGDSIVGTFDGVRPQGGRQNLASAAEDLATSGADVVVSLGGGATIDTAKYLILLHSIQGKLEEYAVPKGKGASARPSRELSSVAYRHVAIPTTAGSSSEIMPWAGIRDEELGEKVLFRDPLLVPDIALLDPRFVTATGPELTSTSGVTALARAVESLYSRNRQPIAEALALQALRLLAAGLPRSIASGEDLEARQMTQVGAMLSGIAADNSMVSIVHAIGHAVGGRYGLQHGVAHRILLPRSADLFLPTVDTALPLVADALGLESSRDKAKDVASIVDELTRILDELPIPRRLRDAGVAEADLAELAEAAEHEPMMGYSPRPISSTEILDLLHHCW